MKNKLIILSILTICLFVSDPCFAENSTINSEPKQENQMTKKLKRGAINIVTSPLEIPKQIKKYWNEGKEKDQKNIVWLTVGTVKGLVNTVGRLGSGVWDVATFNVDKPLNYEPLMKPDFVNQEE